MSALEKVDFETMERQIEKSKGQFISKTDVLQILHSKLAEIDKTNPLRVDRLDGAAVKEIINSINTLPLQSLTDKNKQV
jgi:hypothetical protein